MHLHKAFRAESVTSPLIAAFGRAQLSVSPLPPTETRGVRYCIVRYLRAAANVWRFIASIFPRD